ncbi:MAG TPA: hypothetical protein VMU11_03240 [Verrucomicrobiae bacterium]|nr:hypothetical protein [Verrucomicrobiae bacterium]
MGIFTWKQRLIVYLTNLFVIGTGSVLGAVVDIFLIKNGRYWGTAGGAILSFPFAIWVTVVVIKAHINAS